MSSSIFRKVSIDRLSSPEQLDMLLEVVNPRSWLVFVALVVVLIGGLAFGAFVRVPTTISAEGVLLNHGSLVPIDAPASGYVSNLSIDEGDVIAVGQQLAMLETEAGPRPLFSMQDGRVIQLLIARGNTIEVDDLLLVLEPLDETILPSVLALLPADQADEVTADTLVDVSIANQSIVGQVRTVSQLPINAAALTRLVGSDNVVDQLATMTDHVLVDIALANTHDTNIPSGVIADVDFRIAEQQIWRYVVQQGGE
ncbi:MAG: biotin/lipoyl-containing protein [Candidatus Promineifilaceae bacterium]